MIAHQPLEVKRCTVLPAGSQQFFDDLCVKNNVECAAPRSVARLLDKVSSLWFSLTFARGAQILAPWM